VRAELASDLWWKNAIIYCVDVKCFQDSDGDGIGDLPGLAERLEYLADLGVTCVWLQPITPSPWRDNGYDVADYYGVDARYGSLGDLVELLRTARELGLRVVTDLVVNHTSDQHPWFRSARSSRQSPYRDWYVWRDEPQDQPEGTIFPGEEGGPWTRDDASGQWYLHRFYRFQPDLNIENAAVRREIRKIMGFWLELGMSGFRIDAAPFLIETAGIAGKAPDDDPHAPLRDMRAFLSRRRGDAVLIGEANVPPDQLTRYFGEHGDELHMLFNFILNQGLYLAMAREDATPLREHLRVLPPTPLTGQYANFLRNTDELSLDKLDPAERDEVFARFAPDESMRIYGRGIRRRLASMLDGDQRRLELAHSMLFSLPDTPVLLYGEEIGLAEDLQAQGRGSVRVAMQWSDSDPSGGFSLAEASACRPPVIRDGRFGYRRVNVAAQRRDPGSLLHRVNRMIHQRRNCPEIGFGDWHLLEVDEPAVLALRSDWEGGAVVTFHNLSGTPCRVKTDFGDGSGHRHRLVEVLADREEQPLDEAGGTGGTVPLAAYGYRWFRTDLGAGVVSASAPSVVSSTRSP
jgi:maltose alpha-D-glucosyltransferase/alpha-amylase